ncbi:AMP-binding protein [Nocardia vinacea]|uniref:AMP-binding protein n=1 Tax=Nocardia vinacea TaxID=96468 RepID=A0ABZ1YTJ1_9NOCA|nr:AMP-binding protein [Nocardia vinacea]
MMDKGTRVVREVLRRRVDEDPDRRFVKCGSEEWITFGQMAERVERFAAGLAALGVEKGDRIGVISDTRDEVFTTILACAQAGAINLALNTYLKGDFLKYQLVDSGASVLVVDRAGWNAVRAFVQETAIKHVVLLDGVVEEVKGLSVLEFDEVMAIGIRVPEPDLNPQDLLGLLYTSGTTGDPKGCMLSHGYYTNVPTSYLAGDRVRPGDRVFTAFPFFHTAGQVIIFMSGLCGPAELVYEPRFSASTYMKRAREEEATVLWGVGAMALAVLAQPKSGDDALGAFRLAQFQPLAASRQVEFQERFNVPVITEGYGQTECVPITAGKLSDERHRSSIGRPADHLEVRLVDENDEPVLVGAVGEIVVRPRGPEVMFQGYWGKPEATLASRGNLWHHTGDFATQDEDGFVYFVDRKTDALRRRGENISSAAVENVIVAHPAIAAVAVVGVPAELTEDEVKAVIVVREGYELAPKELFEHCRESLPYFAMPRYIEFVDELPTNALGKIMKHLLRNGGVTSETIDFEALGLRIERHERR